MEQPLAIQFSDLRGFTSLTAERGDQEAFRLAQAFIELVEQEVSQHGGRLLKTYGDGVMTSFDEASQAVQCAAAMQRSVCERYCHEEEDILSAGIGIAWGTAIRTDGDLFGHSVNLAKRLSDTAKGGQIVTTEGVYGQTGEAEGFRFRDIGDRDLKGIGSEHIYEVIWRDELARLDAVDDSFELVLTDDNKLVIGFAKPVVEEIEKIRKELEELGADGKGVGATIQRAIARRVSRVIPTLVDWSAARAGLGVEHPLADIDATVRRGRLEIRVKGHRTLEFEKDQISLASAQRFLERVHAVQAGNELPASQPEN